MSNLIILKKCWAQDLYLEIWLCENLANSADEVEFSNLWRGLMDY